MNNGVCSRQSNLAVGVLSEVGVQDGVGDLVAHLVWNIVDNVLCKSPFLEQEEGGSSFISCIFSH